MCLGKTHALAGGVAGASWAEFVMHAPWPQTAALAGFTAGMALVNDLDACGSSASRSLGFFSEAVAWCVHKVSGGHRHGTHSALGIAVIAALAWAACHWLAYWEAKAFLAVLITFSCSAALECLHILRSHAADVTAIGITAATVWYGYGLRLIPLAVLLGLCAHVALDCMTRAGCPLGWPFSQRDFRWYPASWAFTTGTWREHLVVAPAMVAALGLLAWHAWSLGIAVGSL